MYVYHITNFQEIHPVMKFNHQLQCEMHHLLSKLQTVSRAIAISRDAQRRCDNPDHGPHKTDKRWCRKWRGKREVYLVSLLVLVLKWIDCLTREANQPIIICSGLFIHQCLRYSLVCSNLRFCRAPIFFQTTVRKHKQRQQWHLNAFESGIKPDAVLFLTLKFIEFLK